MKNTNIQLINSTIENYKNSNFDIESNVESNIIGTTAFEDVVIEITSKKYYTLIRINNDSIDSLVFNISKKKPKFTTSSTIHYTKNFEEILNIVLSKSISIYTT